MSAQMCPECAQGKCDNCTGDSWDFEQDQPAPCPCAEAGHKPADELRAELRALYAGEGFDDLAIEIAAMTDEQVRFVHFTEFYVDEGGYA